MHGRSVDASLIRARDPFPCTVHQELRIALCPVPRAPTVAEQGCSARSPCATRYGSIASASFPFNASQFPTSATSAWAQTMRSSKRG